MAVNKTVTPSTTAGPKPGVATEGDAVPPSAPLTPSQMAIIKATVPVLQAHGETITQLMYDNMIKAHPELHNVFSTTSQTTGRQPRALARAVLAYAMYIDDLPKLAHAVERIAQKHASLFIQPEQYDIVATYLMGAIGQVLGDAATPDIVGAWTAAYGVLARVFIDREQELYKADESWTGWRKFRIARKQVEAEGVVSFYVEPVDGVTPLPKFLPGQYVSLQVFVPQLKYNQSRQYSLSQAPEEAGRCYRVSVKRDRDDEASVDGLISNMLHDRYGEGDTVELSHPHGEFFLDPSDVSKEGAPAVLISAGVGATPLVSMLQALAQPSAVRRPVSWIHTSRSKATQPFAGEVLSIVDGVLKDRVSTHVHLRQGVDGEGKPRLDLLALDREGELFVHDHRAEYYICGPEEFMVELRRKLLDMGVDKERVYLELFATGDVEDA
ncbi:Flavohemoprotein [Cytospora mali]|uniref:nitric oxide dioxygenase n=1 Tax=Cytospora mali TaxID=578113 RepID=A0A194VSY7_CYTMA|nr:Flavohemoprotein [Valsa mali]